MTRYRFKTTRRIEAVLRNRGSMPLDDLAVELDMEPRVVRNYLRTHKGVFEMKFHRPFQKTIWGLKSDI